MNSLILLHKFPITFTKKDILNAPIIDSLEYKRLLFKQNKNEAQ